MILSFQLFASGISASSCVVRSAARQFCPTGASWMVRSTTPRGRGRTALRYPARRSSRSGGLDGHELRLQKGRCPVERRIPLIEDGSKTLEHVWDAGSDLEGDRHVGGGCPCGERESVAEQDLVRTHLDQKRR